MLTFYFPFGLLKNPDNSPLTDFSLVCMLCSLDMWYLQTLLLQELQVAVLASKGGTSPEMGTNLHVKL